MPPDRSAIVMLAGLLACASPPTAPLPDGETPTGAVRVTVATTGPGAVTALALRLDDAAPLTIAANGSATIPDVPVGEHQVELEIPGACTADRFGPQELIVDEESIAPITWQIRCPAAAPPGIYFTRWTEGVGLALARASLDGSGVTLLAPSGAVRPVPNPARTRLAWKARHPTESSNVLWVGDADGTNATATGLLAESWDWSPDGRHLLVTHPIASQTNELSIHWPDGTRVRSIRTGAVGGVAWSPAAGTIAYRDGAYIYVHDLISGQRTNTLFILNAYSPTGPAWAPDGTRLAFVTPSGELSTMRADGSDVRVLYQLAEWSDWVDWGVDGRLVFSEDGVLYTLLASGGSPVRLVTPPPQTSDVDPRWAP